MTEQEFIEKHAARTASFWLETFQPLLGETFVYRDATNTPYELRLCKVEEDKRGGDVFENFTLELSTPKPANFAQGYYLLEHAEHGEFPLLLVPIVTMDTERNCCWAISVFKSDSQLITEYGLFNHTKYTHFAYHRQRKPV